MGLFGWIERKVFTGEIVRDYGVLEERRFRFSRMRTSLLLCRQSGTLRIVLRSTATAPFAASVNYTTINVTPEALEKMDQVVADAHAELATSSNP